MAKFQKPSQRSKFSKEMKQSFRGVDPEKQDDDTREDRKKTLMFAAMSKARKAMRGRA